MRPKILDLYIKMIKNKEIKYVWYWYIDDKGRAVDYNWLVDKYRVK